MPHSLLQTRDAAEYEQVMPWHNNTFRSSKTLSNVGATRQFLLTLP